MLSRPNLIKKLKEAKDSNTLLTPKHDPNGGLTLDRFRSVLTQQSSASLADLIESEAYDLHAYYNKNHRKHFYTLQPHDTSSYSTVGLGIPSGSLTPSGSFDTFLIASGSEGFHIFSENSSSIAYKISSGETEDKGLL